MKKIIFFLFVLILCVLVIITPETCKESVKSSLELCTGKLIPGLFPFMVLSNMLVYCGGGKLATKTFSWVAKVLGLNGACSLPFVIGLVSGFPVGASVTAELVKNKEITKEDAENVLCFCNNPGIVFVISAVAGMIGADKKTGFLLWIAVTVSGIIAGLFFGRGKSGSVLQKAKTQYTGFGECVVLSVKNATTSMLNICGFVTFFGTVTVLAFCVIPTESYVTKALVSGFFEVSNGCAQVSQTNLSVFQKLIAVSSFLAWAGVSVHAQVASALNGVGVSLVKYYKTKLLQSVTAPCLVFIGLKLFPISVQTVKITRTAPQIKTLTLAFVATLPVFCLGLLLISGFLRNKGKLKR